MAHSNGKRDPRKKRYAIARAQGKNMRDAGRAAGLKGARAEKSVTQTEWEKDPYVQMLIAEEIRKDMDEGEVISILAAQARGQVPTKIIRGDRSRTEFDTHSAAVAVARCLGLYKESHVGAGGGPIQHEHRFENMTDEELEKRLAEKTAVLRMGDE